MAIFLLLLVKSKHYINESCEAFKNTSRNYADQSFTFFLKWQKITCFAVLRRAFFSCIRKSLINIQLKMRDLFTTRN